MRLIDKGIAYNVLSEYYSHTGVLQYMALREALDRVPVVDAEPVRHGKWEYVTVVDEGFWRCSNCGTPSEASGAKLLYKYCPFCGAKMDGDKHESD